MKRLLFVSLLAVSAATSGLVASPPPAPAHAVPPTLTVAGLGWSIPLTPTVVPPRRRIIEVVDRTGTGPSWLVGAAVDSVDRYTASDMRMVRKCSGKAYRCIVVRLGKVNGPIGWSHGCTITIDAHKALTRYRSYYYRAGNRGWLVAHELGHQFGLGHHGGHNLMNTDVRQKAMTVTSAQRKHLAKR